MKNPRTHATLLSLVSGYLLYLAWLLLDKYRIGAQEMPPALNILAVAVFALGGLGTLVYASLIYRKARREEKEREQDGEETDEESNH